MHLDKNYTDINLRYTDYEKTIYKNEPLVDLTSVTSDVTKIDVYLNDEYCYTINDFSDMKRTNDNTLKWVL